MDESAPMIKSFRIYKFSTLVGAFLVLLPLGFAILWGNMAVYVNSRIWRDFGVTDGIQTPWVLSVFVVVWNLSCYVTGMMSKVDKRVMTCLGMVIFNGLLFASYFIFRLEAAPLLFIVVGGMVGFATAMLDCTVSAAIADWSDPNRMGFEIFVAFSGTSIGNCVFNPLITQYVNPNNLSPTGEVGHIKLFEDSEVVDRVPSMFLVLGGSSLACQIIGLLLLRKKPPGIQTSERVNKWDYGTLTHNGGGTAIAENARIPVISGKTCEDCNAGDSNCHSCAGSQRITQQNTDSSTRTDRQDRLLKPEDGNESPAQPQKKEVTTSMLLRSPVLYALWFSYLCMDVTYIHLGNYFKEYGQQWISDDHFLTNMTIFMGICCACLRISWGPLVDKVGVKTSLVVVVAVGATFPFLMYFMAVVDKWLYLAAVTVLYCVRSTMTPTLLIASAMYFGMAKFSIHFGLLTSGGAMTNLFAPLVFSYLLKTSGWFSSFVTISAFNLAALLAVVILLPNGRPSGSHNR